MSARGSTPGRAAAGPAQRLLDKLPRIADVVCAALAEARGERSPARLLFTSPEPGAGTTVLAAATAIGMAQRQHIPTCLIETDVSRPALASYLGLHEKGLSDVLDGRATLEHCLAELAGFPGLRVLHAGRARASAPGEFSAQPMRAVLDALAAQCRYLVIDAPSVVTSAETRVLLPHVDAAILVLRAGTTRVADATRAEGLVAASGTRLLGSILNAWRHEPGAGGRPRRAGVRDEPDDESPPVAQALEMRPAKPAAPTGTATDMPAAYRQRLA